MPVYAELTADYETPLSAFHKISDGCHSFLLESAESTDRAGRYSFIGSNPRAIIEARGKKVKITENGQPKEFESESGDPLCELEEFMRRYQPVAGPELPVFYGGAVGYLSYDAVRYFEPSIPKAPPDELGLPDMLFMIAQTVVIFDHRLRKLLIVSNVFIDEKDNLNSLYARAKDEINEVARKLHEQAAFCPLIEGVVNEPVVSQSNTTKDEYCCLLYTSPSPRD